MFASEALRTARDGEHAKCGLRLVCERIIRKVCARIIHILTAPPSIHQMHTSSSHLAILSMTITRNFSGFRMPTDKASMTLSFSMMLLLQTATFVAFQIISGCKDTTFFTKHVLFFIKKYFFRITFTHFSGKSCIFVKNKHPRALTLWTKRLILSAFMRFSTN